MLDLNLHESCGNTRTLFTEKQNMCNVGILDLLMPLAGFNNPLAIPAMKDLKMYRLYFFTVNNVCISLEKSPWLIL